METHKEPKKSYFQHLGANLFQKRDPNSKFGLVDEDDDSGKDSKKGEKKGDKKGEKQGDNEEKKEDDDDDDVSIPDRLVGLIAPFNTEIRKGVFIFSAVVCIIYVLLFFYTVFFGAEGGDGAEGGEGVPVPSTI